MLKGLRLLRLRAITGSMIWLITVAPCVSHPYHVSISQIDYNSEALSLEVTIKLFTEDLEVAVEADSGVVLRLGTDRESERSEQILSEYIRSHFRLEVNSESVELRFLGKEVELDDTWCYLEVEGIPLVETLSVFNDLLLDSFETQTNIVHVKVNSSEKSAMLQKGQSAKTLRFD